MFHVSHQRHTKGLLICSFSAWQKRAFSLCERWCLGCSQWASYLFLIVTTFFFLLLATEDSFTRFLWWQAWEKTSRYLLLHLWTPALKESSVPVCCYLNTRMTFPRQATVFPRTGLVCQIEGWNKSTRSPQISSSATFENWEINSLRDFFQFLQITKLKANGALLL